MGTKSNCIQVGDGGPDHYPASSLDIIGHEIGHAMCDYASGIEYLSLGETPKVEEAVADMFAMLISEENRFHDPVPSWIGERTFRANYVGTTFSNTPTHAFRYMDDPVRWPGAVVCYYPGIATLLPHRGAGPGDHMFYLLTYGGTSKCDGSVVQGVGPTDAGRILYNALPALPQAAAYGDLRLAFLDASMHLFPGPSNQTASVGAAFQAVAIP